MNTNLAKFNCQTKTVIYTCNVCYRYVSDKCSFKITCTSKIYTLYLFHKHQMVYAVANRNCLLLLLLIIIINQLLC